MELRQLEYFYLSAKAGSLSAAAKTAFVTQQTLSASIASLENELGSPLFHRRHQGIELTDFGTAVLKRVVPILDDVRNLETYVTGYKETAAKTATFAYATASLATDGQGLTLTTINEFLSQRRESDMRVFELTSDACLSALAQGSVDMALVVGKPDPSVFEFFKLEDAKLLVAVSSDHPLAGQDAISFRDLAEVDVFPVPDLSVSYDRIVAGFEKYGLAPRFARVPFSLENAKRFVQSGAGVDFSPAHNANSPHEGIAYLPLAEEDSFSLPLGLATKLGQVDKPLIAELKATIASAHSQS